MISYLIIYTYLGTKDAWAEEASWQLKDLS